MPKGSHSSENVHSVFRGTSTSTINSVGSAHSNNTGTGRHHHRRRDNIGSAKSNDPLYENIHHHHQYGSNKTLILSKFFNTSNLHEENSPTYENLCSGCGYGVFEARSELCNFCQYVINGCPAFEDNDNNDAATANANIYENICDKCSQLYSGDECLICLENNKHKEFNNEKYDSTSCTQNNSNTNTNNTVVVKSSSKKKLKKRLLHSLFGSLKSVKSPRVNVNENINKSPLLSPRKLEIVHNVDGYENVFSTNETFDLNQISQLKQQQVWKNKIKASTSDHHIYGKLRKREAGETRVELIKQKSQSDDYLNNSGTVSSRKFGSASIRSQDSLLSLDNHQNSYFLQSVCEWMTSLRCETHDYYSFGSPDTVLSNPKSIPGNFAESIVSSFVIYPSFPHIDDHHLHREGHQFNNNNESDEINHLEFAQQMVNEFKRNLMEKTSGPENSMAYKQHMKTKRQGIHLKLDDIENKQLKSHRELDVIVGRCHHENNNNNNNDLPLVGDHNQLHQRNEGDDDRCLLQSSAQAQAISLAAGLNSDRHTPEHQSNKRCCIYEKDSDFVSDILQAYDTILLRESQQINTQLSSSRSPSPSSRSPSPSSSSSSSSSSSLALSFDDVQLRNNSVNCQVVNDISLDIVPQLSTSSDSILLSLLQNINLNQIADNLVLSKSLNRIVISYEIPLRLFLSGFSQSSQSIPLIPSSKLKKIFEYFQLFLFKQKQIQVSSDFCSPTRSLKTSKQQKLIPAIEITLHSNSNSNSISKEEKENEEEEEEKEKVRPHPSNSSNSIEMTVPSSSGATSKTTKTHHHEEDEDEPIYQPIWKFKTLGEVHETDVTDPYYATGCDRSDLCHLPNRYDSSISLSVAGEANCIEQDDDEWEPDDEFTFTTKLVDRRTNYKEADAISVNTIQSCSGSTITGYASSISTMTLASTTSSISGISSGSRLTHHLFRNICIFYSPKDPKIRAVLYEYDRNRCSHYFAQQMPSSLALYPAVAVASSSSSSRTASPKNPKRNGAVFYDTDTFVVNEDDAADGNKFSKKSSESSGSSITLLADSVQAWKYLLLDVNYLEDEEDMIVSESQILKAQTIQEMDASPPNVGVLQRFKSISSSNLLDMPAEEDKKSITERVRNKLQRGVFKLHPRSPKETKKLPNRRKEATASLYLEDGIKPKYPIFNAPLEFLEMNETSYPDVPRFVVDCIEYIEQIDCIQMDGLYRASGNKVSIDELKQKLTDSYIYDPKLLVTDDIHTLTSLLKFFFRELASPLIPHNTYQSFPETRKLMEPSGIEDIKSALKSMKNPNRETLKFLIKHLTTVAAYSSENRMPASNLAIVWGPCILGANQIEFDIARMNTVAKVLIENYDQIFGDNERLVN